MYCRAAATSLFLLAASTLSAQNGGPGSTARTREITGLPAINFDADEGVGYGALAQIYWYGDGAKPYRYTLQPTVFLTTHGRRDVTLFFDSPTLLPRNWRITAFTGREQQIATPYYGQGNASPFDETADDGANEHYYRYGRTLTRLTATLQHRVGPQSLRLLVGAGLVNTTIDTTPFNEGTTLLSQDAASAAPPSGIQGGWTNFIRGGLIWDSRNVEIGPRSGQWAELLAQFVPSSPGGGSYTKTTLTWRVYAPLTPRLVFAQRLSGQTVTGAAPFYELTSISNSFKESEGLGGAGSVRGIPRNRYAGRAITLSNSELRFRAADFAFLGKPSGLVLSTFLDAGRVHAASRPPVGDLFKDRHVGYGGGVRLAYGPSFVVAVDGAHSKESAFALYIGLGYMF